ncbi:MAG TPA: cytochrome c biogenesis protein CcsA [Candidatus Hydrogenedentes bacterium]|nr:cytochrome c biogenesis protein CcsA [Candidatus Hydrogenedentota bacterium]
MKEFIGVGMLWVLVLLVAPAQAASGGAAPPLSPKWDKEEVRLFATLPIQDGGRIKPLDTFARFKLLKFNGKQKCENLSGDTLEPIEWLLDCLFYPESAKRYKVFLVNNSDVLVAIGLPAQKKRGRYSYRDLEPGRAKLFQLSSQYAAVPANERTPVQAQLVHLGHNYIEFDELTQYLHFARHQFSVGDLGPLSELFPGELNPRFSVILGKASELSKVFLALQREAGRGQGADTALDAALDAAIALMRDLDHAAAGATAMRLFPPPAREEEQWLTPAAMMERAFGPSGLETEQVELLGALEDLFDRRGRPLQFRTQLETFHTAVTEKAHARGEGDKIRLEVAFYRIKPFHRSLVLYLLSLILLAFSWLGAGRLLFKAGDRKWNRMARVAGVVLFGSVLAPTLLVGCGIVMRCAIRGRPPVTTLYETILFIAWVVAVVSLFIESVNRQRIALSIGAVLGALGLFLANKYELREGADTMPSMAAVLDTNFWLAAHVTAIAIGYAAGLLASALAHGYVLGRALRLKIRDAAFYDQLSRTMYGALCLSLFFSVTGTVLGGIWANESWGRFWGWDPKENGALMIVLWQLAILHARLGGYIRGFGIAMAAIFGGVIVGFSWFGVNLLGVGLHSYGFTTGIFNALMTFYVIEATVLFLGGVVWIRERISNTNRLGANFGEEREAERGDKGQPDGLG